MLRLDLSGVYLAIIGSHYPYPLRDMQALTGPATWYVGKGEAERYRLAGASAVKESGSRVECRNAALDDAWDWNLPCLMITEDVRSLWSLYFPPQPPGSKKEPSLSLSKEQSATLAQATSMVMRAMTNTHSLLGGIRARTGAAPTKPVTPSDTRDYIPGHFMIVMPCGMYFDEHLGAYEDYDYSLTHLTQYGTVVRVNTVRAIAITSEWSDRASLDYMTKKWGKAIEVKNGMVKVRWVPQAPMVGEREGK